MTEFDFTYELDEYRHRNYRIGARLDPSVDDVQDFAVVLYYETRHGRVVHVARIDNSDEHDGEIHLDRLYRESGAETKKWDIDVTSWDEAIEYIEDRWKKYADIHAENHDSR